MMRDPVRVSAEERVIVSVFGYESLIRIFGHTYLVVGIFILVIPIARLLIFEAISTT
jgi:hypothetical protein